MPVLEWLNPLYFHRISQTGLQTLGPYPVCRNLGCHWLTLVAMLVNTAIATIIGANLTQEFEAVSNKNMSRMRGRLLHHEC